MKFLDEAKIYIEAGSGGRGGLSFRREKFIEFGGPDGGHGGRGGDIYAISTQALNTLIDYRYQQHFKAEVGQAGMGRNRTGASGNDMILKVPVGTQVLSEDQDFTLADFTKPNQKILLARAGDGGFGNAHYKTSTNRAPRRVTPGWPGESLWIWLRLKLIADVGVIGLPNAGKSTFLSAVSRAHPKIADYPFTTLSPNLGVILYDDQEFVMADLPGLIEGAHQGHGLGHRFLKHAERCSVLLHMIDATRENPFQDYQMIRYELEHYQQELAQKPEIIALNKCDTLSDQEVIEKCSLFAPLRVHPLSALHRQKTQDLVRELLKHILTQQDFHSLVSWSL